MSQPWLNVNNFSLTNFILILDIDETLAHTNDKNNSWHNLKIRSDPKKLDLRDRSYVFNLRYDVEKSDLTWGIKRPHLKEFLLFCFNYFKIVIIWSAGTYNYVHSLTEILFDGVYEPTLILTRDDCVTTENGIEKPFWKLLEVYPELKDYVWFDQKIEGSTDYFKNVFIVDDRKVNFRQNPNNGIQIPEFFTSDKIDDLRKEDNALIQLMNWFNSPTVLGATDIRTLDKSHIFDNHVIMHTSHKVINPRVISVLRPEVVYS